MIWLLIIALVFAIFLIICENLAHDCAPGRKPTHKIIPPDPNSSYIDQINQIRKMVHENSKFIIWRQGLILAIILPFFIIYFLKGRLPTFFELVICGLIIFIGVYSSYIWLWSRYFYPNTAKMEKALLNIEGKMKNQNNIGNEYKEDIRKRYLKSIIKNEI